MSPDEDRQVAKNGEVKNGTSTPATNGALALPPLQQNGQRKRNSSTVPPVMNPLTIINNPTERIVYRLVLTGGPCSGKTTGQARLSTFFENLGWKVYRVPETATTLFSGGIRFPEMSAEEAEKFQENLIKVMIAMERTFFTLANSCKKNCIVICDRGIMDATAYMSKESWEKVLKTNGWNSVELRDNRYNQIVHLVTSADGAEEYYNVEDNPCRTEGIELARELDRRTIEAWVGHPYIDVLDNSTDFDTKMRKMISAVCRRIGIEAGDRLKSASRKIKFLVKGPLPTDGAFPPFQDFDVVHDYLITANPKIQSRLRKRGQNGNWSYQHTVRRSDAGSQLVELRRQISHRDYVTMLSQRSDNHHTVYKVRRCFLWQQTYFQLDIYKVPCNTKCFGLILLETYTTLSADELKCKLPPFLTIVREVTSDYDFSMYNLSMKTAEPGSTSPVTGGHGVTANGATTNGINGGGKRKNSGSAKTNKSITTEPMAKTNGISNGKSTVNGPPFVGDFVSANRHSFDEPVTIEK